MCISCLKWKWRIEVYFKKLDPEYIWHLRILIVSCLRVIYVVGLGDRMEYNYRILGVIVKCEGPHNILSAQFII